MIQDLIEDISIDENLQYDEFLEGEKEIQQLLSELKKTNKFLLLNLDKSQHYQFLDETLAGKRNSRKKINIVRRKIKVSCDPVNNSADAETRLPTSIKQQTDRNDSERREFSQKTLSASKGITLSFHVSDTLFLWHFLNRLGKYFYTPGIRT